jgi:hypothetical protein
MERKNKEEKERREHEGHEEAKGDYVVKVKHNLICLSGLILEVA